MRNHDSSLGAEECNRKGEVWFAEAVCWRGKEIED